MKATIQELNTITSEYASAIAKLPEAEFSKKSLPDKWSKKEVLGHLIDSAQNNLRRFICGQYEESPPKIIYEQNFWVLANDYQSRPSTDVINSWVLINAQICSVLLNMPSLHFSKSCDTGCYEVQLHSLQWLTKDYVKHLKHHLNQIIPGSFDIIYQ